MKKKDKKTKKKKIQRLHGISIDSSAIILFLTSSEEIAEEIAQEFKKQPRHKKE